MHRKHHHPAEKSYEAAANIEQRLPLLEDACNWRSFRRITRCTFRDYSDMR